MAYSRPLGQTFNQLNLNMYRLPDGQRGALRSTSLALAREASREDSHHRFSGDGGSHLNPFKGIKRLYSGLRRHKSRTSDDGTRLRKFYSTPLGTADAVPSTSSSSISGAAIHSSKTTQTSATRRTSDSSNSETGAISDTEVYQLSSNSPTRSAKRVHFSHSEPEVKSTYSPEEYDRRVVDPWEFLTRENRVKMREEMHDYTSKEMAINDVYSTNDCEYCTLCWRQHCHCRALAKDIWRRDKSTSMVRAGA